MKKSLLALLCFAISACAQIDKKSLELTAGMSKQELIKSMGAPDTRSFSGSSEAWQYSEVVGFGQCSYITVWLSNEVIHSVTSRKGSSIAGCGLGSSEVDWGHMPKTTSSINVTVENNISN